MNGSNFQIQSAPHNWVRDKQGHDCLSRRREHKQMNRAVYTAGPVRNDEYLVVLNEEITFIWQVRKLTAVQKRAEKASSSSATRGGPVIVAALA